MLTKNEVIEAVCRHLEHDGHRIISRSATRQRGIGIVAEHSEAGRVVVEAKGETSARTNSKRHGKAIDAAQVRDHVANAVYTGVRLQGKGDRVVLALPDSPLHRRYLEPVSSVLTTLAICIYLGAPGGTRHSGLVLARLSHHGCGTCDVTDRSHHWIGAILPPNHSQVKMFRQNSA